MRIAACLLVLSALSSCAPIPDRDPVAGRELWLRQLDSPDEQSRWWAVVHLADVADARDFESLLAAGLRHANLRAPLSVRLRDWKDRRAVPFLADLLGDPTSTTSANAAISLGELPPCPKLKPDLMGRECQAGKTTVKTDYVGPYLRWWKADGASLFKDELAWWSDFKERPKVR